MQNITGNFATEQGVREGRDFPSLPPGDTGREMLLCRPLDYRHGPPGAPSTQKGPRALLSLIVLLPVRGKALGVASREGGLFRAPLSTSSSGFSCTWLPRPPSSPSLRQQFLCLPLALPPRKEGLPTLKALCVGLAGRPLVRTGCLHDHGRHLDEVQGALVVFQGLAQV